ncbi:MAG: DUF1232 domain-containing protein [Polyangiales bacterium]
MSSQDDAELDEDSLKARLKREAAKVTERDAERLSKRESEVEKKVKALPGKLMKLVNQVKLLFELIRAYVDGSYREVPWSSIAVAVAAVVYFMAPIDLIPDAIPGIGYIDDLFVIRFAISTIQSDLRVYCEWKGHDVAKYFD